MGKMQIPQKLRSEDFKSDQQDLINKIAGIVNQPFEEIYNILSNNVDFINLNRQIVQVNVTIDKNGKIASAPQIKVTLKSRVIGTNVINQINLNDPGVYPTSGVNVSFTTSGQILTILNVAGLQASSQYQLTLELIGA